MDRRRKCYFRDGDELNFNCAFLSSCLDWFNFEKHHSGTMQSIGAHEALPMLRFPGTRLVKENTRCSRTGSDVC
jgi:hypothetical protein